MKILIINNVIPGSTLSGADLRLTLLVRSLQSLGHSLALASLRPCTSEDLIGSFANNNVAIYQNGAVDPVANEGHQLRSVLCSLLLRETFDMIILALWFWEGLTLPEICFDLLHQVAPGAMIGVLSDDSHGLRQAQIAELDPSFLEVECVADYSLREEEAYRKSDFVIVLSESERDNVLHLVPHCKCFVIPFRLPAESFVPPYEERSGLCFLGNYRNAATRTALDVLVHQVLPLIRSSISDVSLCFGGACSGLVKLAAHDNIHCVGHVDDLATFFGKHRVFVCPTPYGTGVTTKVALAMSYGIPVTTTRAGLQSLRICTDNELILNSGASAIATSTTLLYKDRTLWETMSREVRTHQAQSATKSVECLLDEMLQWVMQTRNIARRENNECSTSKGLRLGAFHAEWNGRRGLSSFFLRAGSCLLADGKPQDSLAQFRHALSVSKTWLKTNPEAAPHYRNVLNGFVAAYSALNDAENEERAHIEGKFYSQLMSLKLFDQV